MTGTVRRRLSLLFGGCATLLPPWICVLIYQAHGTAGKRSFDSSWIGLDLLEACCLAAVALLLRRGHRATSPAASATAAVLCLDAWFDGMSAPPQWAYAESLAMAIVVEFPLAAVLFRVAWRTLPEAG